MEFFTTRWTLVAAAASGSAEERRRALQDLVPLYVPALRAYLVTRKRFRPDRADDLIQSFLASKVLEQGLFARADPAKGKLRHLIVTALQHHVADELRYDKRLKRDR